MGPRLSKGLHISNVGSMDFFKWDQDYLENLHISNKCSETIATGGLTESYVDTGTSARALIVSHGEVTVKQVDMKPLSGKNWISDNIIGLSSAHFSSNCANNCFFYHQLCRPY
ncbi:hypothetical protein ACP70R_036330 [Stipagrostis hirtigluma subsp. patula]